MPVFNYHATDTSGRMVTGVMEAPDKGVVIERLQKESFFPISVEAEKKPGRFSLSISLKRKSLSQKELVNFTRQMATLLNSGLELDRCLGILFELGEQERSREVIRKIQESVHGGQTLAGALANHKDVFSPLFLNMVKAGETGGFLEKVFDRLAWYLENRAKLIETVRSAMIYPAVVLITGLAAILVLTTHVIPRFGAIFEKMGGELPFLARSLVSISEFVLGYWALITVFIIAAVVVLKGYIATESGRHRRDIFLLKLPLVGDLIRKTTVAQFTRTLGTLLQSGIPIIQALGIVKETISNRVLAEAMEKTAQAVKEGKRMSTHLKSLGLFPPLAIHMIMVGEESGKLDDMMLRMAHIYDDEVETAVKRLLTLFEPALILFMGLVVAFVVVSMLSAIISLNDLPF